MDKVTSHEVDLFWHHHWHAAEHMQSAQLFLAPTTLAFLGLHDTELRSATISRPPSRRLVRSTPPLRIPPRAAKPLRGPPTIDRQPRNIGTWLSVAGVEFLCFSAISRSAPTPDVIGVLAHCNNSTLPRTHRCKKKINERASASVICIVIRQEGRR
jgi:hypothetical protein